MGEYLFGYVIFFDFFNLMVDFKKNVCKFFFLLVVVKLISDKEKFDKFVLEYMLKILINVCL